MPVKIQDFYVGKNYPYYLALVVVTTE